MSRNARQRPPATPVKPSKRRGSDSSSSLGELSDLSDSDGYSAVGGISDSDEDEEDVIAAEEEHILENDSQANPSNHGSPWPSTEEAGEEGDDEEEDDDLEEDDDEEAVDHTEWEGFMSEGNDDLTTDASASNHEVVERRVRFAGVPDSDGDTTETDDGVESIFPDIFVDQSSLDPTFRREIENDVDNSSDSGSFWDLHGSLGDDLYVTDLENIPFLFESDSTPVATPMTIQEPSTTMSTPVASPQKVEDDMSDGYQSDGEDEDGGDTTDEDEEPAKQPLPRKTHHETPAQSSDSDAITMIRRHRGRPRVGRFNLDSDGKKPIAVVNPRTGKLMIFTPQRLSRLDLSPEAFNFNFGHDFLFSEHDFSQSSPILSNSGNLMMGAMVSSNTFGDFMNGSQAVGPAEAFLPPVSALEDISEEDEYDEFDEDHDEQRLKLDDFLDIEDFDGEQTAGFDEDDDYWTTPQRPDTPGGDVTSLLDHSHLLNNSHLAGAFRRDQQTHQLLRSGKATRESLAFSGPLHHGTLRGIKDGRIASTNIPISPMRKHKRNMSDLASSPLAGVSQKRKSSSEQQFGHKRQRSIPDMEPLTLQ
ncbi:putative Amidase [Seiridium unicorne]|uniref:Amidase n=1 Tax=Seiridium unicorne TaxID=138068 RepID=A0ABR2VBC5_9PEZI